MVGDVVVCTGKVRIIILRLALERAVRFESYDGRAALRIFFVDTGVGEIVDGHTVGETDGSGRAGRRVVYGEIVVVIVSAENALHTVRKTCFEKRVGAASAEYAVGANAVFLLVGFAHSSVNELGCAFVGSENRAAGQFVFGFARFDDVRLRVAVLGERDVEEREVVDFDVIVDCF